MCNCVKLDKMEQKGRKTVLEQWTDKREVDRRYAVYLAATCGWCSAPKTAPNQRSSELTFSTVFIPLKLDNSISFILQYPVIPLLFSEPPN